MTKGIQWFMERLVERIVPIVGSSFATTLETMHTLNQAEQQNQIEEAARRYEADGKPELAAQLRESARRITADTPGEQGVAIIECFERDEQRIIPPAAGPENDCAAGLINSPASSLKKKTSRKRRTLPEPSSRVD